MSERNPWWKRVEKLGLGPLPEKYGCVGVKEVGRCELPTTAFELGSTSLIVKRTYEE